MRLGKDDILKAQDIETEEVEVPEWQGTVLVRALSGRERDAYELSCIQERPLLGPDGKPVRGQTESVKNWANARAKLVVRCLVDDDGNRLFADGEAGALGEKSAAAIDRLFDVATRLSRLSEADVEELAGNSEAAPGGDSPSSSPANSAAPSQNF